MNNCNVLIIDSLQKLDEFHVRFPKARPIRSIDWVKVRKLYDGVEIAPYQYKRRLHPNFSWYYGWDCASGVIWRPKDAVVKYIGIVEEINASIIYQPTPDR